MGNSTGNTDKNVRKQANIKNKRKTLEYVGKKRKGNTGENNNAT